MKQDVQSVAVKVEENEKMTAENKSTIAKIKSTMAQEKEATMKELFKIEAKRPNLIILDVL